MEITNLVESRNKRRGEFDKLIQDFDQTCKKVLQNNMIPGGFYSIPAEINLPEKQIHQPQENEKKNKMSLEETVWSFPEDKDEEKKWMNLFTNTGKDKKNPEIDLMTLLEDKQNDDNGLFGIFAGKNIRFS